MLKRISVFFIVLYQRTISPDHGLLKGLYPHGVCRYHPTCSQYTKEAIEEYGFVRGSVMGLWRVMRCNPWSEGGNDPVRKKPKIQNAR